MVRRVVGSIDIVAGTLTLDDGRVFTLDDIPGNPANWPQQRLDRLAEAIQDLIDVRFVQADLPLDDPDRTATPAELLAEYGNRVFLDGADIVHRSATVTFTWDGSQLIPHVSEVR